MAVARDLSENDRIRNLVPLNTLNDARFDELLSKASIEQVKAGRLLFKAGDVEPFNVYLLSGKVVLLEDGQEVDRVHAESDVARFPLAHRFPRKQAGRALGRVTCLRVDNRVLSEMLSRGKATGYEVQELAVGDSDDWMEQLLGARVMHLMPNANLQEVLRKMEQVELAQGEEVFHQGDEGDYYYFISRGHCRLTRSEPGGVEHEIAQLGPGDSFGEDALLSGSPRSCTIGMLSDGVLIRLSKENFDQLIKQPLSRSVGYGEAKRRVAEGAVWMDVRSPSSFALGHLGGSVNLPFDLLRYQMDILAADREYIVYCDDASTSTAAAYLLTERDFNVAVLKRGLEAVPARELKSSPGARAVDQPAAQAVRSSPQEAEPGIDLDLDLAAEPAPVPGAGAPPAVSLKDYRDQGLAEAKRRNRELEAKLAAGERSVKQVQDQLAVGERRIRDLQEQLAAGEGRIQELQDLQAAGERRLKELEDQRSVVDPRLEELQHQLSDAERRLSDQEQRYEGELAELRSTLAAAQKAAAIVPAAPKSGSSSDLLRLKQALTSAESQLRKLSAELEEAEDRHIAETDEVHQLWEKRLRALEEDLEQVKAERDDWRRRCEE